MLCTRSLNFILLLICFSTATAQWSDDPLLNTPVDLGGSTQAIPLAATVWDGSCYIAWLSVVGSDYTVRLQYFDQDGYPQWEEGGILVCHHPTQTWVSDWDMAVDQDGYAVLVYSDFRNSQVTVGGYRVSPEGELIWGEDGIQLSGPGLGGYSPRVCVTSDNHAVFTWGTVDQPDNVVYLQRVSPAGEVQWSDGVIVEDPELQCQLPDVVPATGGDVFLSYSRMTSTYPFARDLWAQKFNSAGEREWGSDEAISTAGGIAFYGDIYTIPDHSGGAFICWGDDRDYDNMLSAWVQHIDSDGVPTMPINGAEVSTAGTTHHMSAMIAWLQASNSLIAFWEEKNSAQSEGGLYAQKFTVDGERLWGDSGLALQDLYEDFHMMHGVRLLPANEAVAFYSEFENGSVLNSDLYAIGIDLEGEFIWDEPEVILSDVTSQKIHTHVSECNQDQWVATWEDDRNGNGDIYAQNLNSDGTLGAGGQVVQDSTLPAGIALLRNYPNPFNPATAIEFTLTEPGQIELVVFDLQGRRVADLNSGYYGAGTYTVRFEGGESASGMYFYRLTVEGVSLNRKMLLLR